MTYKRVVDNHGPWRVNVLEINLRQPGLVLLGVRAKDSAFAREPLSSMYARYKGPGRAVAAINTDFFNLKNGESEINVLMEGKMVKGITITDSPHETFDNVHYQFGVDWKNRPYIDRFAVKSVLHSRGRESIRLGGINAWADSNAIVLYTPAIGAITPPDTSARHATLVPLRLVSERDCSTVFRVSGNATEGVFCHSRVAVCSLRLDTCAKCFVRSGGAAER